ncbi:hypothetical protein JJB07_05125 [Tumebacillus sp. ITR2]|uniref:Uncharacterized protein n=1 Tax=Tumebacillus amylolyticus TaxID=2801339 RepID=A0ABS1J7K1_9BACL|nr:hypothetical protein [Tumebacillus amylolyticus]MBL0386029.1 hypothetical protein [Tumebacillus amylolyticus]
MNGKIRSDDFIAFLNWSVPLSSLRRSVLFLLVLFVDIFMLLPIYMDPYVEIYRNILLPPIAIIHLYAFWIVVSPIKRQIASRMYIGVFASFVSLGYLVLIQKFLYSMAGLRSPLYAIGVVLGAAIALIGMIRYLVGKVENETFFSGKNKGMSVISLASSLGVVLGHVTLGIYRSQVAYMWAAAFYGLSIAMMFLAVVMIYRYILIRRHPELFIPEK